MGLGERQPEASPGGEEPEEPEDLVVPRPSRNWGVTRIVPGGEGDALPARARPQVTPDVRLPRVSRVRTTGPPEPRDPDASPIAPALRDDDEPRGSARKGLASSAPDGPPEPEADFVVRDAAAKGGGDPDAGASALGDLATTAPPTRAPARPEPEPDEPAEPTEEHAEPEEEPGEEPVAPPPDLDAAVAAAVGGAPGAGRGPASGGLEDRVDDVGERVDAALEEGPSGTPTSGPEGLEDDVDEVLRERGLR